MWRVTQLKQIVAVLGFGFFLTLLSCVLLLKDMSSTPKLKIQPKDYYILSSIEARKTLEPLLKLRKKEGFKIRFLDWKLGLDSIAKIRTKRAYLLLVGSPQSQLKEYYLPSYRHNRKLAFIRKELNTGFPRGEIQTMIFSDTLHSAQNLIVGRFPASTSNQLKRMVENTLNYESSKQESKHLLAFSKAGGFSKWIDAFIEAMARVAGMLLLPEAKELDWIHTSSAFTDTTTAVTSRMVTRPQLVLHAGLGGENLSGMLHLSKVSRFPGQSGPWILLSGKGGGDQKRLLDAERLMLKSSGPPAVFFHSGIGHTYSDSLFLLRFLQVLNQKDSFSKKRSWSQIGHFSKRHLDSNSVLNRCTQLLCYFIVGLKARDLGKLREYKNLSFQYYGDPALTVRY